LADGEPIDIALQKAKIKFLSQSSKQNSLPYFWAAAILAGKSEAPRLEATHRGNLLFVLAGLIGLTVIIAWYWRRR
jgi:ABC-type antimicrobial peptide transport system permease subunit